MKKLILILLMGVASSLQAQITFDFTTAGPKTGVPTGWSVSDVSVGNTTTLNSSLLSGSSSSLGYSGASGDNNASISAKDGAFSKSTSSYFQITLSPSATNVVRLTGISFGTRSTASGPTSYSIYSSLDNYGSAIANGSLSTNSTWVSLLHSLTGISGSVGEPVTIRIYGAGGSSASAGNWRLDDIYLALGSTLPVSLTSFIAQRELGGIQLKWQTASEANSKDFEIRKSFDGSSFSTIGVVNAAGTSSSPQSYKFLDRSFAGGQVYYQLVQRDLDGRTGYSKIVAANSKNEGYSFSPVLKSGALVALALNSATLADINLLISDLQGHALIQKTVQVKEGSNEIEFNEITGNQIVIVRISGTEGTVSKKYYLK